MQKVTMTKYIDSEGKQIAYGDILRLKNYQPSDKPYAPKAPYYMVVKYDKTEDLVYCSTMDDFIEISAFQLDDNDVRLNKLRLLKLDISQDMIKDTLNFFEDSSTDEICPYCSAEVELPPHKGIFECPECGKLIVSCSMCEPNKQNCSNCKLCQLAEKQEK